MTVSGGLQRQRTLPGSFPRPVTPRREPSYSPWEAVFADHLDRMPSQFVDQFLRSPDEQFVPLIIGTMSRVWHRPRWLRPAFEWLAEHGILVSGEGSDVPMTLTMLPRCSSSGRPYNICLRLFEFGRPARWNTIKTWDPTLRRLVEYVGRRRRLMVVLDTSYDGAGVLTFETERIAVRFARRLIWLPPWLWRATMGTMRFVQSARPDGRTIDISLTLTQSLLGAVFGYEGSFEIVRSDELGLALT